MLKLYVIAFLAIAATASYTNVEGYNYRTSESQTTHHVQPAPQQPHHHYQQQTNHNEGYEKHFYYFNAPEEHFDQSEVSKKITQQKATKHLQEIFIKPPEEKHHEMALFNLAKNAAVEEKTHIYVLMKEPDHAAIAKKVQQAKQATVHHHKPEVHYIKYHTPAEAQHAQQAIIQQYGGKPSEIIHSVSAPVINFISSKQKMVPHNQHFHHQHHQGSASANREYVAPPEPIAAGSAVEKSYAEKFLPTGVDVVPGSSYIPLF